MIKRPMTIRPLSQISHIALYHAVMKYALLVLLAMTAAAAQAAELLTRADEAYREGDFHLARNLYHQDGSAAGLMGACRTGLVIGGFHEAGDKAVGTLHQAISDCASAAALGDKGTPEHVNARISYAIGIGLEGKRLKKLRYAKASKRLLEDLIVVWPNNSTLQAAIGGWHSEVHEAGFLARLLLGAKRHVAEEHLLMAIALAPSDMGARFEYMKFLARGKKDDRAMALEECDRLLALEAAGAFEYFLQQKTQEIRNALLSGKKKLLKAALGAASPFADIGDWRDLPPYPLNGEANDDPQP